MACEYLILNASDINIQDLDGQSPLFFATELGMYVSLISFSIILSSLVACGRLLKGAQLYKS